MSKRLRLAGMVFCLYFVLLICAGGLFLGKDFVPRFFWITIVYGLSLGLLNVFIAKQTQRYIYGHIHRLAYHPEEISLSPGDLKKAKADVLTIPWVAATRDLITWIINGFVYTLFVLTSYARFTHDDYFTRHDPINAFFLIAFPLSPLMMVCALLAYSAATNRYVQYFFREGEYEKYRLSITPSKRRYLYAALVGYTLLCVIAAQDYNFTHGHFTTIQQAFQSAEDTQIVGLWLVIGVCSSLMLLSRMEFSAQKRMPLELEVNNKLIVPDKKCPKCQMTVGPMILTCPRDGTALSFPGDESATFGTNYEFLEEIARGGMSVIFKARHRLMKKIVAIKMMDTRYISDRSAISRFAHESQAVSRLVHPHIVAVFDFGQFESQKLFLVMEYLTGTTLAKLIAAGNLPVRDSLLIFDQICDAMSYAHQQKVLHRDLKPTNIMVAQQEMSYQKYSIKIVDFGIAKVFGETMDNLTKTGDVFGTPDYMSPEQCLGMSLDIRSDVYSMGCLMYETLTGKKPFEGENSLATMYKQINEQPVPIAELRADLASYPGLSAVIYKALAKQASERYANFDQLRLALKNCSAAAASSHR
jgi:serine/threonine-protein kinase